MKKMICEIIVDEERLKEVYLNSMELEEDSYNFKEAFYGEFGWLEESGIKLVDWRVIK